MDLLHRLKQDKGPKLGLALGGGAALGAAHIGVLKALDELDIQPDYLAGTSVGAMVGAMYAFGKSWPEIRELAEDLEWFDISGLTLSRYGLLSNEKMANLLEKVIGEQTFDRANIPLAIVATDIAKGEKVILREGEVAPAVMASTCIPGIFVPVEYEDEMLVDGGIVENVPISPLQDMGAEVIIGVDLNAKHAFEKPGNIVEVLINAFHFTLITASQASYQEADLVIQPDLGEFSRTDPNQTEGLMEAGYKETMRMLGKKFDV